MQRIEAIAFPLPPEVRGRLLSAGFKTLVDLQGVRPVELARDASISYEEAIQVLKIVPKLNNDGFDATGGASIAGAKTAWELLNYEKARKKIVTLCEQMDIVLGGGFCPREVTEICGVPGVGKTQLGMQLALNVQIPAAFGGLGGHAVYIDTEGSFMLERMVEMADALLAYLHDIARSSKVPGRDRLLEAVATLTCDDILNSIHYFRAFDHTQQTALLNTLGAFLTEHPQVRLVVIDSMTFHFRHDFEDMAMRTRFLSTLAQQLMAVAEHHDVAVSTHNCCGSQSGDHQSDWRQQVEASACTRRELVTCMHQSTDTFLVRRPKAGPCLQVAVVEICNCAIHGDRRRHKGCSRSAGHQEAFVLRCKKAENDKLCTLFFMALCVLVCQNVKNVYIAINVDAFAWSQTDSCYTTVALTNQNCCAYLSVSSPEFYSFADHVDAMYGTWCP